MYKHSKHGQTLEYVTAKCRPVYLPRELEMFSFTVAVYIPPDDNASSAVRLLHGSVRKQQSMYLDAVLIIARDFKHRAHEIPSVC